MISDDKLVWVNEDFDRLIRVHLVFMISDDRLVWVNEDGVATEGFRNLLQQEIVEVVKGNDGGGDPPHIPSFSRLKAPKLEVYHDWTLVQHKNIKIGYD